MVTREEKRKVIDDAFIVAGEREDLQDESIKLKDTISVCDRKLAELSKVTEEKNIADKKLRAVLEDIKKKENELTSIQSKLKAWNIKIPFGESGSNSVVSI
jgi:hypothetical protein